MKMASIALAAVLLAAPTAMAQTPTEKSTTPPERSMTPAEKPMTPAEKSTAAPMSSDAFYSHKPGEVRASKLIGSSVRNTANESIGSINEVVLDKDGKVAAVVIGVGGFLGIGEREVAMNYAGLKFAKDSNGSDVINVNTTKDQLKAAPEWKWEAASGSMTRGAPPSGSAPK